MTEEEHVRQVFESHVGPTAGARAPSEPISSGAFSSGDRVRVLPEFDIPEIVRGGKPSAGVVDHIYEDGTLIVVVDGTSVPYQPHEVESDE